MMKVNAPTMREIRKMIATIDPTYDIGVYFNDKRAGKHIRRIKFYNPLPKVVIDKLNVWFAKEYPEMDIKASDFVSKVYYRYDRNVTVIHFWAK